METTFSKQLFRIWPPNRLHTPPGDLDIPLHPHPIVEPFPQPQPQLPQGEPIPTQADTVPKVSAIRREVRRVFQEKEEARAARVSEYTMQGNLFTLLQAKNESITWKSYMWDLPRGVLGHRAGNGQMMKDVSRISLVCLLAIFQARNDTV
jgi:hypothetical protein